MADIPANACSWHSNRWKPLVQFVFNISVWLLQLCLFFSCAIAADISLHHTDGEPKVIIISGTIFSGDSKKFQELAYTNDEARVALISDGGSIRDALEIANDIKIKRFSTYVASNNVCASACALIWLAGTPPIMGSDAKIGFHAAYTNGSAPEISSFGNAMVGSYLNSLGLSEKEIVDFTAQPPTGMHWLEPRKVFDLGLGAEVLNEDEASKPQLIHAIEKCKQKLAEVKRIPVWERRFESINATYNRKHHRCYASVMYGKFGVEGFDGVGLVNMDTDTVIAYLPANKLSKHQPYIENKPTSREEAYFFITGRMKN